MLLLIPLRTNAFREVLYRQSGPATRSPDPQSEMTHR
jgi:hypothetical protein